jgi:nucleotide-binding universal stress UspA family protein
MHPLRNILCATDLDDSAGEEITQAAALAAGDGARLVVLHVVATPSAMPTTGVEVAPPVVDTATLLADATAALARRLAHHPRAGAARPEVVQATSSISAEILRRGQSLGADLIVTGSHNRSLLQRLLLGSTARGVVRHADRPVLVARPGRANGPVVAATDLTQHSLPALRAAAEEARRREAQLLVVHGLDLPSPVVSLGGAPVPPASPDDPRSPQAAHLAAQERLQAFLRSAEVTAARPVVAEGDAAASIVLLAEQNGASLIAVGTSSKSGLQRVLLGSVAEAVVNKAHCSVLTVPGKGPG